MIILGTPNIIIDISPTQWAIMMGVAALYFGIRSAIRRFHKRRMEAINEEFPELHPDVENEENEEKREN